MGVNYRARRMFSSGLPAIGRTAATQLRPGISADHLPITSIWKEFGIIGARGPRIPAGPPGGGIVPEG